MGQALPVNMAKQMARILLGTSPKLDTPSLAPSFRPPVGLSPAALDCAGQIIQHYKYSESLPTMLARGRSLALHPGYAFVEVYPDKLISRSRASGSGGASGRCRLRDSQSALRPIRRDGCGARSCCRTGYSVSS
ncbi:hypothetical protein DFO50_104145 [Microvirgula sp. AG722]|nr:hypothetical protein DFO50_104145 [Microvirgula sp. AG722]